MVKVISDHWTRSKNFTSLYQSFCGFGNCFTRFENVFALFASIGMVQAKAIKSLCNYLLSDLDHFFWTTTCSTGKCWYPVTVFTTQKLVNWHVKFFPDNVVQSYIDSRNSGGHGSSAFKVLATIHFLPERSTLHWITANKEFAIMFYHSFDCNFSTRESRFSPSIYALISFNFYQHLVACANPDGKRFDISNFHGS